MRLIHRSLYGKRTFWGFRKLEISGYRFGFGRGFIEWGSGLSGIYLARSKEHDRA
ncbi:hypothetical protein LCGC14_1892600 [marine sediment metagenome]|uniref:Uncharacterized protein n=1 Tax=marine sediment metagenome TaxID=412755 RepID=A0A0F9GMA5_9ZZZZ